MNIRWIRWIIVIAIICTAVLVAGYRLVQPEPAEVSAAPINDVLKTASLDAQATTIEQVEARGVQTVVAQTILFEDDDFDYHVNYPVAWERLELSSNVVIFQAADGLTRVKIEAVGSVSADGLAPFVDRSLYDDVVLSRQTLTVHGYPAQRVITFADSAGGQKTTFFIETTDSAYVITGMGQQALVEGIARSFNAPQVVAQR